MADVRGFKGIRYNPEKVRIGEVITPPYDIINDQEREGFYEKSPHSTIRLILNKPQEGDGEGSDQYTRSRDFFEQWQADETLIREKQPAIYIYEQEFETEGQKIKRMGYVATSKLYEYEEGVVIPHERTLSRAKGDRYSLMMSTQANFGLIFMLYHDPTMSIDQALRQYADANPPTYEAVDTFGVTNRMWVATDPSILEIVHKTMEGKKLYIADGHHRYETAVNYRNKMRETKGDGDWDYCMMMFVNMKAPGLIILPTHRWVKGFPYADIDVLLDDCMDLFEVHPLEGSDDDVYVELERRGRHNFLVFDDRYHMLSLKDEALLDTHGDTSKSKAWRGLDVSIMHSLLLERHLGIDQENIQDHIKYTRDRKEAVTKVLDDTYEAAFMMVAPTMDEFLSVADAGEKMPQKSTYFYPKLASGLVFSKLDGSVYK
ncbi:MAG: DUF1015 domain-containing protein [Candidatus Thermoplasmatota archaeon]|nr:DUF1015 domain-containing protein [Candidatus Thermoplasmatota archaeon]